MAKDNTAEKTGLISTIVITVIGAVILFAGIYHLDSQTTTSQVIVK